MGGSETGREQSAVAGEREEFVDGKREGELMVNVCVVGRTGYASTRVLTPLRCTRVKV